jgi:hypothetical protein
VTHHRALQGTAPSRGFQGKVRPRAVLVRGRALKIDREVSLSLSLKEAEQRRRERRVKERMVGRIWRG